MWLVSDPPRAPRPANATIEIDKSELEVILGSTPPPPEAQVSVPPPLPPEEIARAQSLAPAQPVGISAAPGVAASSPTRPSLVPYMLIAGALMVFTGVALASLYYWASPRTSAPPPIASASAVVTSEASASASASPSSAPAGTTLTIHTVELGGKPSE